MATGVRALTLKLIADIDDFNKNLNKGTTEVEGFSGKIEKFGKIAGAAFAAAAAAAGAYAVKIGIDGVKAAMEDEKSQRILSETLIKTTGATKEQIAAVESYISKTALATGVTDDELRPAMSRLARSTKDSEEAQKLLNLALDISSATGKPLEAVANALGKAYDGNATSLGRLGLGLDANILKSKDFDVVFNELRKSFGGFAEKEANTLQGRLDRLKVAFDEAKETIGYALLPIIERLVSFVVNQVVPNLQKFASAFDPIIKAINDNKDSFQRLFNFIGDYVIPILTNLAGGALRVVGEVFGKIIGIIGSAIDKIADFVESVKNMVNAVISAYNRLPTPDIALIGSGGGAVGGAPGAIAGGGSNAAILGAVAGLASVSSGMSGLTGTGGGGGKGTTAANKAALARLEADAAKLGDLVDQLMGVQKVDPFSYGSFRMGEARTLEQYNITVNGAIDSESTARQIVEILNDSSARGTLGAGAFDR